MASLRDKITIITGAGAGMGAAFARHFACHGSKLAVTDRDVDNLNSVAEECVAIGLDRANIITIPGDITDDDVAKQVVTKTVDHFGGVHVLINNVGIGCFGGLDLSLDKYEKLFKTNLRVAFLLTQLCAPELKKTNGTVVNVSSVTSHKVIPVWATYSMFKAALDHFTRCTAAELGPFGVRVNSVNPGAIRTKIDVSAGMSTEELEAYHEQLPKSHALGRTGEPEEVAKVVGFLASDDASFMSGSIVLVDGGASVFHSS